MTAAPLRLSAPRLGQPAAALALHELAIFRALAARLDLFIAQEAIDVAYPGLPFIPRADRPFLRPWQLPALTQSSGFGARDANDFRGIWQVDVFWPDDLGILAPLEKASKLMAHYGKGLVLHEGGVKVQINEPPYLGPALQEPGWLHLPVNIRYRAFA
jgi:hypothetical protein